MKKALGQILLTLFICVACSGGNTQNSTISEDAQPFDTASNQETRPSVPAPTVAQVAVATPTVVETIIEQPVLVEADESQATATLVPTPTNTDESSSASIANSVAYNLPQATLVTDTGLYASPNRNEQVVPVTIPAGQIIYLMGRNATSSHLRAVWGVGVGWVPVSFTDYSGERDKLETLPIFEQEPPPCAEPVTTQFSLDSTWPSDRRQRIVVVVDLFRSRYGDFPQSYISLAVNGNEVESSRRPIVERGQFSLKDIVFSLPGYLQPGDTLGYQLNTTSNEPLAFLATIFRVPEGCVWD